MSTNEELIGRADVNDLEAILGITNTDVDAAIHAVKDNAEAIFTWDYEKGARTALNRLYEKAKHSQWNGERSEERRGGKEGVSPGKSGWSAGHEKKRKKK